ncbi:MAG: hypothetical protein QM775_07905 [Pirellulales bacterium]
MNTQSLHHPAAQNLTSQNSSGPPLPSTEFSGERNPAVTVGAADPKSPTAMERHIEDAKERRDRPIRAGVFATMEAADRVVDRLFKAGFSAEEISVVCSEEAQRRHFGELAHDKPAGTYTPAAAVAGSVIGAALGGLVAVAGVMTTGGVGVLASGGIAAWSGGVVGGLIGAMMTRGFERELANFYDQAVTAGKIVVAVDIREPDGRMPRLAVADQIFRDEGAESLALPEG